MDYSAKIDIWYKANNISHEKLELFHDFLFSLNDICYETYLGKDYIKNEDIEHHFKWCWNKNIDNFSKENILFKINGTHYEYFYNLFYQAFYNSDDFDRIPKYLDRLFNLEIEKTPAELNILVDVYKILNLHLTK